MKLKWRALAITLGISSGFIPSLALAEVSPFRFPEFGPSGRALDATYWEWDGRVSLGSAVQISADIYCRRIGYRQAFDWSLRKDDPDARGGTYRYNIAGNSPPTFCASCRWGIERLRCER